MKEKQVFFNPFRIISPRLDAEASRLAEIYESPPAEVTCLEEGLLIMIHKLGEMADLIHKSLIIADGAKLERCELLAREVHQEEKGLTGDLVCSPATTGDVLKTVILFPGRLERAGDLMESLINVAKIKSRDGILFSDKALAELNDLFGLLKKILNNFGDLLLTRNRSLADHLLAEGRRLGQMTVDFALAHEDRLVEGVCAPKASSLYLDILDSVKNVGIHVKEMIESMLKIADAQKGTGTN
jgi:Na+/phosphate symporter